MTDDQLLECVMTTLLTLKETAARIRCTPDQVVGLVADGELKYVNVGRGKIKPRYRFDEADIGDFIEQQRTREEPPCQSSRPPNQHRTSGSTSKQVVVGFTAARVAEAAKKPKSVKR
jgi:excisionase family DNA binding protein